MRSRVRTVLGRGLIFVLIFNGLTGLAPAPMQAQAQDRVIVVNADQPNVWTLEQAHYLLAQMHRRNLDLKATGLGALDPNEINGLRFDVLRQLVELGVEFNQADRETNKLISENQNFNSERRQTLLRRRDELQDESLGLTRDITDLQNEKARSTDQADKDRLDAQIAAKTARRAEVDKRIEQINEELKTLNAPSGSLQATEAQAQFNADRLPKSSAFDDAFKDAAKTQIEAFNQAPKLNAMLRLENFLQMQYEIVAKQLTLLRDEVGPGERLLFLELPQTVNVTHHEADKKWAQSWWRIVGYTRNCVEYNKTLPQAMRVANQKMKPGSTQSQSGCQEEIQKDYRAKVASGNEDDKGRTGGRINRNSTVEPLSWRAEKILSALGRVQANQKITDLTDGNQYVNLQVGKGATVKLWGGDKERHVTLDERTVRSVELIPRQSSLNVNDMKLRVKSGAFSAVASFLFGFGARLNVQRQREQFSQFVQQELYSSAFGKGAREFGWTFTPMPGTDRLLSGVRTTYAVVVVPEEATFLMLEANGCYFPRSAYQPNDFNDTTNDRWSNNGKTSRNCGESKAFLVPIPVGGGGRSDFFVDGVTYRPVEKGQRIVISVHGYNFSAQTGVLVNGSPLTPAIGLAQPLIRDDSEAGRLSAEDLLKEKVHGRIERIDSEQMVFSFDMPADFVGTPTITLVAPGKAIDLNRLDDLYINGDRPASLSPTEKPGVTVAKWMFGQRPVIDGFRIDSVEVFRSSPGRLSALINGAGFLTTPPPTPANPAPTPNPVDELYVNGVRQSSRIVTSSLIVSDFQAPADETIQVTLINDNDAIKSSPVTNPAFLRVNNVAIVSYEPPAKNEPGVLVVKIEGSGFTSSLQSSIGSLVVKSPTEAFLTILNPAPAVKVRLYDPRIGFETTTIVTRKPPPK